MTASQDSSIKRTRIAFWKIYGSDWLSLDWNFTRIRRAGSNSAGSPKRTGDVGKKGNLRRSISWVLPTSVGRTAWDGLQFGARRSASAYGPSLDVSSRSSASECTIPCPKPVSGSNRSCRVTSTTTRYQVTPLALSLFRHRLLVLWWHSVRRRSQKRRISWTRMLDLATRWLPAPQVLHPYPEARFAATHPR